MKIGVYVGSFDPLTNGHLDIINRASNIFDKVIVLVAINTSKNYLFSIDERVEMLLKSIKLDNVFVEKLEGLLANYLSKYEKVCIIKGIRNYMDFEYEYQMSLFNKSLNKNIETVFLASSPLYNHLNSTMIKEINYFGADISEFVPEYVAIKLYEKR